MKKTVSIALVVLTALAMFGVGYAWWSETLYVEGTVETGSVAVTWVVGIPSDDEATNKDYSSVDAWNNHCTLFVEVTNAYPSITYTVPVEVENTGTIPVDVSEITFTGVPTWATVSSTLKAAQVHPGETAAGEITIHLDSDALQADTMVFSGELTATQWNAE